MAVCAEAVGDDGGTVSGGADEPGKTGEEGIIGRNWNYFCCHATEVC